MKRKRVRVPLACLMATWVCAPAVASARPLAAMGSMRPAKALRSSTRPHVAAALLPQGIPGAWMLSFDDEFDASRLDTNKWSVGWYGSGITKAVNTNEQDCYSPAEVAVVGGALDLGVVAQPSTCGGVTQPYTSALISTEGKFSFTYGAFEARIWLPTTPAGRIADWPAFWADGQHWPLDGEIDVVEGLAGHSCWHFHYLAGGPGGCAPVQAPVSGWHTYAANWEPGSITYYYDGTVVGRQTTGVTAQPMYLILNLAVSRLSGPIVVPAKMKVDYVRVWRAA